MRGRKPKPTAIKMAAGNPGKRPLNNREPRFSAERPTPPKHLDAVAKAEWRRIINILGDQGVMTLADRAPLAAYCIAYARWAQAEENVRKYGTVLKSAQGGMFQSPYLSVANKAMEQMVKLSSEFGLTPASRTRIQAEPLDANEDLTELLFRKATQGQSDE